MRGGGGALTRSGLDDSYYWDAERWQFTIEPLLPLAPGGSNADAMSIARVRRGHIPGRCSACGGQVEKSPLSGRWWHLDCTAWWAGGEICDYGEATEQPARFVEDAP